VKNIFSNFCIKSKYHLTFWVFVLIFCFGNISKADSKNEVTVYIKPMYINFPDSISDFTKNINEDSQNRITLNAGLPKSKYKIFEPVVALLEYVNNSNETDTVYNIFKNYSDGMMFNIVDENNNVYNKKVIILDFLAACNPSYILMPKDTLRVPITLNSFGKPNQSRDEEYFDFAFFPIGNYKAFAHFEHDCSKEYNPSVRSNEIEFEVIDLTEEDIKVLSLFKENKFDEIFDSYKNNSFTSHIMRNFVSTAFEQGDNSKIVAAYNKFFQNYPNSIYNFDLDFILSYLIKLQNKDFDFNDINSEKDKLLLQYPSLESAKYLKSSFFEVQIRNFADTHRK